jgi:hypothetical protein
LPRDSLPSFNQSQRLPVREFGMKLDLTWKKLLGEGLSNQQIETMLLLGVVPIILLTIWFMVFLYNNLAPELEN